MESNSSSSSRLPDLSDQNNNKTTPSSFNSVLLRDVQAAVKRHRVIPQLNNVHVRRSVVPQRETSKSSGLMIDSKADEAPKQLCDCRNNNMVDWPCLKCKHVLDGPKKVRFASGKSAQSHEIEYGVNNQLDVSTAPCHDVINQSFYNMEVDLGSRSNDETSSLVVKGTTVVQTQVDPIKNFLQRDFGHQMTSSSVVGSNCTATTLLNSINAPMLSSTTRNSQPSHHGSSHVGSSSDLDYQQMRPIDNIKISADQNLSAAVDPNPNNKCVLPTNPQGKETGSSGMPNDSLLLVDKSTKRESDFMDLQFQAPISNDQMYDVKQVPVESAKNEKPASKKDVSAPRKRNNDHDSYFKVNGKHYQRLGKIGSGGSSEVHKVISQDCTIYALKRIKLKGRDYATAYGFCQEVVYLNKLKKKDHIIQLIDYEVTDKALLKEVMSGSMSNKDGRVKDDGLIYMVLEYGEIDLAHMLSQKWKELDNSSSTIDENWLRFYWQQILLAVKTIHEERIVHSDLKPANFLLVRGSLKLIDFGIAKAILSDTTNIQRDSQVGTLSYMSPEAFLCNETDANGNIIKCGRPSDIWSLGCILYQMVYGRTPFADYATFWAKLKVITDPNHEIHYEPLSNIWLLDLMKKCLAWERNERWTIPQLLQHPFLVPPSPTAVSNRNILQLVADSCIEDPNLLDEISKLCLQLKEQRSNSECD
uniref:serine/threonine-protein kinase MPS1 n=1 Tax=Erigeron canadensis TaxID=72917 RepID=UPI001CB8BEFE|nr:serine/threonine-protein kinase MPS1 [Erigeron canadensis]